jgi:hypothetical protein
MLSAAFALMACDKESDGADYEREISSKSENEVIVLGKKLENPYSIDVMRRACSELASLRSGGDVPPEIEVTDLYVRFLPKDSAEYNKLLADSLELFDYPLDYEIEQEGSYYHDPSVPEGQITWQYTTVKPDYKFPDMTYEILEECYLPELEDAEDDDVESEEDSDEDTNGLRSKKSESLSFAEKLERKAFELTGNSEMLDGELRAKRKKPSGYMRLEVNASGKKVPLKGVKIRCHNIIRWGTCYTDGNGYYKFSKKWRTNVRYAILFENRKSFSIGYDYILSHQYTINLGGHKPSGIDEHIGYNRTGKKWTIAVINNAAYDYYELCAKNGILTPPKDLRIWRFKGMDKSCALLAHHGSTTNLVSTVLADYLGQTTYLVKRFGPDIVIGTEDKGYEGITSDVFHELAHASHFSQVGVGYWQRYVAGIVLCAAKRSDLYGTSESTTVYSGYIGVGEMWGYFMEEAMLAQWKGYEFSKENVKYNYWFKPQVYGYLYEKNEKVSGNRHLQIKDIYKCLNSSVTTQYKLKKELISKNPSKKNEIEYAFKLYN